MAEITRKLETYGDFGAKVYLVGDSQRGLAYLRETFERNPGVRGLAAVAAVYTGKQMRAKVRVFREAEGLRVQASAFIDERKLAPEEGYPVFPELEALFGRETALAAHMHGSGDLPKYLKIWVPGRGLIIEDEPRIRENIRETLDPYGFSRIDAARDRGEVEEVLAGLSGKGDFDLMTVDCGLGPDLGFGGERRSVGLVRELIQRGEDVKRIIVCSGDPTMGQQSAEIGVKFVSKYRYHKDMNSAIIAALSDE